MATLFPAFSHHGAVGTVNGQTARLFNVTSRYLLFVFLPLFALLIVDARDVLTVWMGPKFSSEGTLVLQILAGGALVNFLARVPYVAVQAVGRPDITGKFHLIELPLYIALCALLIPRWGIVGAALACTLRLSLDAFLMFWAAQKICHLRPKWIGEIGRAAMIVAFLVMCLLGVRYVLQDVRGRLGLGVGLLGLAYVAIWVFALNGEDKPAIVRTIGFARQEGGQ